MQSHDDRDFINPAPEDYQAFNSEQWENLEALRLKAEGMVARGESGITAGRPGEVPLIEAQLAGVYLCRMPEDEHKVLRVSLGESEVLPQSCYLVFRGDPHRITMLLRKALKAMELRY